MELFDRIEREMNRKKPLFLAIDGRCGSGKSTLAGILSERYPAGVIHMDDFFLRPEQRTQERLAETGGNIDYERFLREAAEPIRRRSTSFSYRKYDCGVQRLTDEIPVCSGELIIVEGVYSCHPVFGRLYDLTVFLDVDRTEQRRRLAKRCTEALYRRFVEEWIPKEEAYFDTFGIREKCDIRMKI